VNAGANAGGKSNAGQFVLYSIVLDQFNRAAQTNATFYSAPASCPVQTFGDCIVHPDCPSVATYVSAGTLTVTSPATATLPANNVTVTPNADNTYDNAGLSGLFSGGEAVHISASGATVPAFSANLTAPLVLLIDSPTPDATGIIHANASSDLVIQFSRGAAGVALFAQNLSAGLPAWLECTSAPNASSMTIPKAALAAVGGPIYLLTRATQEVVAGDFTVTTGIFMNAYTPDKQNPVTIQFN
jgi:hypothetical protein